MPEEREREREREREGRSPEDREGWQQSDLLLGRSQPRAAGVATSGVKPGA